jgi:hypothetical protein
MELLALVTLGDYCVGLTQDWNSQAAARNGYKPSHNWENSKKRASAPEDPRQDRTTAPKLSERRHLLSSLTVPNARCAPLALTSTKGT